MPTHRIFRYSRWDLLLVAVIPFQVLFFFGLANEYSSLSWPVLLALVPACFAVSLQNTGASHNHSHTPLFRVRWLNTLTTMGFSFNGSPKTPFHIGHGVHHRMPEPWSERSLLALCGLKRPVHHQLLGFGSFYFESLGSRYLVLLWLLKRWPIERVAHFAAPDDPQAARCLLEPLLDPDTLRATKLDLAAWILFRIGLCVISWKFFLFYFVPVSYLVQTIRYGDNFFQHWGATDPDDPTRDSVSCYGRVYNALTFNLGYHQEHHYRPGVHWLKLKRITAELPADRRTVPGCHYFNVPLFYPKVAKELSLSTRK